MKSLSPGGSFSDQRCCWSYGGITERRARKIQRETCFQSGICSKNRRNTIFFCGRCNTHDFETFFFSFVEHYLPGDYMLCPRVFLPFLTSSRYTAVGMTPVFFCTYFSRYRTAVLIDSRIIRCYTGVQQYLPGWGE